jgi:hypothetical protein
METKTWGEHLAWCKNDALRYLPEDPEGAIRAMASDLSKFEGEGGPSRELIGVLVLSALMGQKDTDTVRKWIEGWN